MRILPTQMVRPGMRLGRSVFDPNGRLVIAAGITLHQRLIDLLMKQGYASLYIADSFGDVDLPELVSLETRQEATRCVADFMKEEAAFAARIAGKAPFERAGDGNLVPKHRREMAFRVARAAELLVSDVLSRSEAIIGLLDIKSLHDYTFAHSVQVALNSIVVGRVLGYGRDELGVLGAGALLHDIGKTVAPSRLWGDDADTLTGESEGVRTHPEAGFDILRNSGLGLMAAHVAFQHHERWDGSGYPRGLKDTAILRCARICAVCDVFDSMTSDRPYKAACHPYDALSFVVANSGILFDPQIVDAFSRVVAPFPVATSVKLSSGEVAVVRRLHSHALDRPEVVVVKDPDGRFYRSPRILDLSKDPGLSIETYTEWNVGPSERELLEAAGLGGGDAD